MKKFELIGRIVFEAEDITDACVCLKILFDQLAGCGRSELDSDERTFYSIKALDER
jgi:hypothetical protein